MKQPPASEGWGVLTYLVVIVLLNIGINNTEIELLPFLALNKN